MTQTLRLSILTVILAVPLGTAFAIGIDRWRGRPAAGANFIMLFSFVVPEIILGVSLFLTFSYLLKSLVPELGTTAQVLGLVTFQLSYPFIIVRARLLTIGPEYEEAAMDLGGNAEPGAAARAPPAALPRDPGERRPGPRGHGRQLRDRAVPVGRGGHRAPVGEDLLGRPVGTDAGGERGGHGHARRHAARDLAGMGRVQAAQPGQATRASFVDL